MNSKIKVLESNLQQFQAKSAGQSNAINDLKEKKDQLTKGNTALIQKKTSLMMRLPRSKHSFLKIMNVWGQLTQKKVVFKAH